MVAVVPHCNKLSISVGDRTPRYTNWQRRCCPVNPIVAVCCFVAVAICYRNKLPISVGHGIPRCKGWKRNRHFTQKHRILQSLRQIPCFFIHILLCRRLHGQCRVSCQRDRPGHGPAGGRDKISRLHSAVLQVARTIQSRQVSFRCRHLLVRFISDARQLLVESAFGADIAALYGGLIGAFAVRSRYALQSLGSLGPFRPFRPLHPLNSLGTLGAGFSFRTLRPGLPLGALDALKALRPGFSLLPLGAGGACGSLGSDRPLQISNLHPGLFINAPDVNGVFFCRSHGVSIPRKAGGVSRFQIIQAFVSVPDRQVFAVRSLGSGLSLGAGGALGALCSGFSFWSRLSLDSSHTLGSLGSHSSGGAFRPGLSLLSLDALHTSRPLDALRASGSHFALQSLHTLGALGASDVVAGRRDLGVAEGKGQSAQAVQGRVPGRAFRPFFAPGTLCAGVAFVSLVALVSLHGGNNRLAAVVAHRAVIEPQPGTLGECAAALIHNDMAGRSGGFPSLAIGGNLQHLVAVLPDVFHLLAPPADGAVQLQLYALAALGVDFSRPGDRCQCIHQAVIPPGQKVFDQPVKHSFVFLGRARQLVRCRRHILAGIIAVFDFQVCNSHLLASFLFHRIAFGKLLDDPEYPKAFIQAIVAHGDL